jgi:hypothetical protein
MSQGAGVASAQLVNVPVGSFTGGRQEPAQDLKTVVPDVEQQSVFDGEAQPSVQEEQGIEVEKLRVSDNVYGILMAAGLDRKPTGGCLPGIVERCKGPESREDFSPYFWPALCAAILSVAIQAAFMYWIYWTSVQNNPKDNNGEACCVHVTLKLISVGLHFLALMTNLTGLMNHDKILSGYKCNLPGGTQLSLLVFAWFSEAAQFVLYLPVGLHYIMVQTTAE